MMHEAINKLRVEGLARRRDLNPLPVVNPQPLNLPKPSPVTSSSRTRPISDRRSSPMTIAEYNAAVDAHADGLYRFALKHQRDRDLAKDTV